MAIDQGAAGTAPRRAEDPRAEVSSLAEPHRVFDSDICVVLEYHHAVIGQQIGSYQVLSELGRGGMGEVYRAMDTKLGREVAVKVLPAVFSEDAERLGRFKREARFLAQLQHPNIASIYGLEDTGQAPALVMELVDGPTLAERLEEGALSLDETLGIARQITEALEAAHEKGIVHRDLKPQNIKAPVDGTVKVLDFGLAKALDATGDGEASVSAAELAASPTLTLGATLQGVILGTASYMAPEQAKGGVVDKRADIWSFGVVLYEMLSGGRLFGGDSVPETLAEVLKGEIDFDRLPDGTPPASSVSCGAAWCGTRRTACTTSRMPASCWKNSREASKPSRGWPCRLRLLAAGEWGACSLRSRYSGSER
ncbi:MAG: serine/threonine protein kinase [Thermoanaerobaculia bacterium]|nr:serine/threonine protein kinase [Thermoanaerobaculia bacterium]